MIENRPKTTNIDRLLTLKVSLYRRVNDLNSTEITLNDWLHKVNVLSAGTITELRSVNMIDPKKAKTLKSNNLPCATISGVFRGERKADQVSERNPVICIDIDDKPSDMTWRELKDRVFALPYVFYCALSARGEGVYALVCFNPANDFLQTFWSLEKEFKEMGIVIDTACKDICRLRFASYDDHPLEKKWYDDIEIYDRTYIPPTPTIDYTPITHTNAIDIDLVCQVVHLLVVCGNYRADSYEDWLLDGFRLAVLGDRGHPLFMELSRSSANFNEKTAEKKWNECVRTTRMDTNSLLHYYKVARTTFGPGWKKLLQ